jgi:hypothetical protein
VHGTGEVAPLVVEHPGFGLYAFAGAIDMIATATPATKSDEAFMDIFSQIPRDDADFTSPRCHLRSFLAQ